MCSRRSLATGQVASQQVAAAAAAPPPTHTVFYDYKLQVANFVLAAAAACTHATRYTLSTAWGGRCLTNRTVTHTVTVYC